jgi:ribosomal protein S18 acetylase RimI-like enzyme
MTNIEEQQMESTPTKPFHIRSMTPADKESILDLARSLVEFFPEDVIPMIETSLGKHPALVGFLGDEIIGFLVYASRESETSEIMWMGIKEDYHGLGLGSMILETLERLLERKGINKLIASTLAYTVKYKPFEKVRAFYYHRGFKSLGIQQNYYEDGFDRLILLKKLQ